MKQKLIIFEKSHSFWINEKKYYNMKIVCTFYRIWKKNVIKSNHDNFFANHFDVKRILKLIRKKYYWSNQNKIVDVKHDSNMRAQIKKYCETCAICKKNKTFRHKSYEKLSFFYIEIQMNWHYNEFRDKFIWKQNMKRNNVRFDIRRYKSFDQNDILHFDQKNDNRKKFRRNINSRNY
jgi:hypothetical protein